MKFEKISKDWAPVKMFDGEGCELMLDSYRDTPINDPNDTYRFVMVLSEEGFDSRTFGLTRKQARKLAKGILKELSR